MFREKFSSGKFKHPLPISGKMFCVGERIHAGARLRISVLLNPGKTEFNKLLL